MEPSSTKHPWKGRRWDNRGGGGDWTKGGLPLGYGFQDCRSYPVPHPYHSLPRNRRGASRKFASELGLHLAIGLESLPHSDFGHLGFEVFLGLQTVIRPLVKPFCYSSSVKCRNLTVSKMLVFFGSRKLPNPLFKIAWLYMLAWCRKAAYVKMPHLFNE